MGNVPYNLATGAALPGGWTIAGLATPLALAVGQSTAEPVTLTLPVGAPLNTIQNTTLTYGPAVTQNTASVLDVSATGSASAGASFVEAGRKVEITSDVLAGMTQAEQGSSALSVTNRQGAVVFQSTPVAVTLSNVTGVTSVDLGPLETTGFAPGAYTLIVTISDSGGNPIAGATGQGTLLVGSAVTANQSLSADTLAPGDGTVTNTLSLAAEGAVGQVTSGGSGAGVVLDGNYAYVPGQTNITIVDVSDPTSPTVLRTFGDVTLNSGTNLAQLAGGNLVVVSPTGGSFKLLIYSLADPKNPQLLGRTTVPYQFASDFFIQGTTAFVATSGIWYTGDGPSTITGQFGDFVAVGLSNPANPALVGELYTSSGTPDGGPTNEHAAVPVGGGWAYVLGTTASGSDSATGQGRVQVVSLANPASLAVAKELDIPGTVHAVRAAVQGNYALVVGSSGGYQNPFNGSTQYTGNVTLTVLDVTNPASPAIVGSTLVTAASFSTGGVKLNVVALGGNQFAVSDVTEDGSPVVLVVDASDPANLAVGTFSGGTGGSALALGNVNGMAVAGRLVYLSSDIGLTIYRAAAITNLPVTVEVQVPNNTGVAVLPGSFNIAPSQTIDGASYETLVWNFSSLAQVPSGGISWQTSVTALQAGEARPVTLGTTLHFVGLGTATDETLPPLVVAGVPAAQSLVIPVQVVVPGAAALVSARLAASQIGNTALATQFGDLSTALTSLVEDPTNAGDLGQSEAAITSIVSQITGDPFLAGYAPALVAAGTALAGASTAGAVEMAVTDLGNALASLAQAITDEAAHRFTLGLATSAGQAQPGVPTLYTITMQNTGSQTTTYDFSISGLPAGVTATFTPALITLTSGEQIPQGSTRVTLSLSQSGTSLVPANFTATATAEGAAEITAGTPGQLLLRPETLLVGAVTPIPPYTTAGGKVDVSAVVQGIVNQPRAIAVSYQVTDVSGKVLFTSSPAKVNLDLATTTSTVDLGAFDSTGLANGEDMITVTAADQSSPPLPAVTGTASVNIGLPVTASLFTNSASLPTGTGTVTTTLTLNGDVSLPNPLSLEGSVATTPTTYALALYQYGARELAYVSGSNGIDIVDVTNPASPVKESTIGAGLVVQGGQTIGRVDTIGGQDYLLVNTTVTLNAGKFTLLVYSLADPLNPSLVSQTAFPYEFAEDMLVSGDTILVPTIVYWSYGSENGNVVAINVSNPAAPTYSGVLYPSGTTTTTDFTGTMVNSQIAYVACTTRQDYGTTDGVGQVLVVNYSDPTKLAYTAVTIPNTQQVLGVTVQGNEALVVGLTNGTGSYWGGPSFINGTLTLTLLDTTDQANPTVVGSTFVTQGSTTRPPITVFCRRR